MLDKYFREVSAEVDVVFVYIFVFKYEYFQVKFVCIVRIMIKFV